MDITTDFGSVILGSNPGRGTGNRNVCRAIMSRGGYGSVAEQLVANQLTRVRFSLPAQKLKVDKHVDTGDKGQRTFREVREIINK